MLQNNRPALTQNCNPIIQIFTIISYVHRILVELTIRQCCHLLFVEFCLKAVEVELRTLYQKILWNEMTKQWDVLGPRNDL